MNVHNQLDDLIRRCGEVTENLEFGRAPSPDTFAIYVAELARIVKGLADCVHFLRLTPEERSAAIRHLLDLHIAEQEGLNPPTPQEWQEAVDRAFEALGEIEAMERA